MNNDILPISKELKKNIILFCIYRFLSRFYMYLPILAVVLYKYGLSYIEISYIIAIHGVAIMVFKAPLGYLTQKISSKRIIIFIGEVIKTLGILGLAVSHGNLSILLVAQVLSGTGFALTSSIESALLFDTMKEENAEGSYREIEARSQGYSFLSMLISGVIGSIIAARSISLPLFLSAPFSLLSGLGLLLYTEKTIPDIGVNGKYSGATAAASTRVELDEVYHLLIYYAFNRAVILLIFVYVLPLYLLNVFSVNLALMGTILGLFTFSAYITANNFEKLSSFNSRINLWIVPPMALTIAILFLIIENIFFLIVIPILFGIAVAIVRPLAMGRVNEIVKENRSLVMSKGEQIFGILNALFLVLSGAVLNLYGMAAALYLLLAIAFIGNMGLVFIFEKKRRCQKEIIC